MSTLFTDKLTIAFGDCDPQGILFYSRAFEIHHRTLENYMSSTELGWAYWFNNREFAVPIRSCRCEFLAPINAGSEYQLQLKTIKVGDTSLVLMTNILFQEKPCAQIESVHVFVDRKTFDPIIVPSPIKKLVDPQNL